jgi:ethanolamine utilization microcompartment shell protein EutS
VNGANARPVVGLFGAFDTGELGEVALRRVLESELIRRRPDIDVVTLAPFGAERPIPGDEGRPARPLPLAAGTDSLGLDALIIAGDVLGDDEHWATRYPAPVEAMADRGVATLALTGTRGGGRASAALITWFALGPAGGDAVVTGLSGKDVWARDLATQERLGGTAVQSGDPILLAARVFSPDALRRRTDLLRLCGALPAGGRLVIEAVPRLANSPAGERLVDAIAAAMRVDPKLSVVVVNLDPTRTSTLRLPGLIAERVHHLPVWVGLDDIAAAMSGSVAVVATCPAGAHLAASLGVPVSAIDFGLRDRFDPAIPLIDGDIPDAIQALLAGSHPVAIDAAIQTLDGAFAELAERLPRTGGSTRTAVEPDGVGSALAILQQRLVDERTALQAEISRVQSELDHLRASPEHRITRPIREGYQRWQRRRT